MDMKSNNFSSSSDSEDSNGVQISSTFYNSDSSSDDSPEDSDDRTKCTERTYHQLEVLNHDIDVPTNTLPNNINRKESKINKVKRKNNNSDEDILTPRRKVCLKSETSVSTTINSTLAKQNQTNCTIHTGSNSLHEFGHNEPDNVEQSTSSQFQSSNNERVLDMLDKIYGEVIGIKSGIEDISNRISKLEEMNQLNTNGSNISNKPTWNFPIKNLDDLELFENKLLNKDFHSKIVLEVSLFVKDNVPASVRSIMYKMFDDNVLIHFSFTGRKKSRAFFELRSISIVFDAVRKRDVFQHVPEYDIIKPLQLHLAQAKFRIEKKNQGLNH